MTPEVFHGSGGRVSLSRPPELPAVPVSGAVAAALRCYVAGDLPGLRAALGAEESDVALALRRVLEHLQGRVPYDGNVLLELERTSAAYERLVATLPDCESAVLQWIDLLVQNDLLDTAEGVLHRAAPRFPDGIGIGERLGRVAARRGDAERAEALFRASLERAPKSTSLRLALGALCIYRGDARAAADWFRSVLEHAPHHAVAMRYLGTTGTLRPDSPECERMRAMVAGGGIADADRAEVLAGLASVHDGAGEHERAFEYALAANAIFGRLEPYDTNVERHDVAELAAAFGPACMRQLAAEPASTSERPVLIVGMPRSGTTLVEQILAAHPQVTAGGELRTLTRLCHRILRDAPDGVSLHRAMAALTPPSRRRLADEYLAELARADATAARVTDKMPHNYLRLGLVAALTPRARIIWCRRDPLDTCTSCFLTRFVEGLPFTNDLHALGVVYRLHEKLIRHWREVLPNPLLEVRYEELVESQEPVTRRMVEFLGLDWDDACLRFHEVRREVTTSSALQVRRPLYRGAIGRWRRYERFLEPLRRGLSEEV